jgi:hypothetical protein
MNEYKQSEEKILEEIREWYELFKRVERISN